ncbi:protein EE23 [Proboscivirus elephantidbeta5]|uniref:Protein EE23 n=1 Tax=Elephant endotheliotropic herpesvirus 5 TaxID=768738 RepID=A0A075CZU5_9BETA|nr:protein EE23 [Elephant endotheliotropic herpesvirus 5]AHC02874.1 protein EE23 [Elephant endotheliotropic herpesvirus 5]
MFRVYLITILAITLSAQDYEYEGSTSLEDLPESKLEAHIMLTNQSGETNITCIATCNPQPSVTWNGENISNATVTTIKNSNDTVTVKSTISVDTRTPREEEIYCEATCEHETVFLSPWNSKDPDNFFSGIFDSILKRFEITF